MSSIHVAVGFFCQPMSTEDNCYLIDEGNYRLDIPDERTPLSPSRRFADTLRGHCHDDTTDRGIDKRAKRKLLIASGLCLCFMIGEVVGGALAQSLAIMTDAAHLLTDFASFLISLLALFLAQRPSTKKMSFGWHRAEVVGALASVLMIWLVTGILVYLAVMRIMNNHYDIDGKIMLITSAIGVAVNIIMLLTLHDHGHGHSHAAPKETSPLTTLSHTHDSVHTNGTKLDHEKHNHQHGHVGEHVHQVSPKLEQESKRQNITVRAALIHVIGDLVQSVGVMIAAMIIYFRPHLKVVDPICTFLFSILVLITTINVLRDALSVLMEATPRGLDFNDVKNALNDVPGVVELHNLRMWSLTMNKTAVSVHLAIEPHADPQEVLYQASTLLRKRYLVHEVTVQLEPYSAEMADCQRCQEPIR
ncbi:Zinc transporter 2 [Clonorchis sinensis]|uniref:Zinc transporter 2 n=1 Tax=Clonorchis sinensis TaxID=79923 RepID=A0A8T1MP49_CLOSI|nr:Zinc transporter 2 [Clonorchis sinensis]